MDVVVAPSDLKPLGYAYYERTGESQKVWKIVPPNLQNLEVKLSGGENGVACGWSHWRATIPRCRPMPGGCYEFPKMTYRVLPDHRILIHIPFHPSVRNQTRIEIKNMDYE